MMGLFHTGMSRLYLPGASMSIVVVEVVTCPAVLPPRCAGDHAAVGDERGAPLHRSAETAGVERRWVVEVRVERDSETLRLQHDAEKRQRH